MQKISSILAKQFFHSNDKIPDPTSILGLSLQKSRNRIKQPATKMQKIDDYVAKTTTKIESCIRETLGKIVAKM